MDNIRMNNNICTIPRIPPLVLDSYALGALRPERVGDYSPELVERVARLPGDHAVEQVEHLH